MPYGGVDRVYERVIPPGYDGTTPLPLIVNLHGFTSTIEQQNLFSNLPKEATDRGYLLITPQAAPATLSIGGQDISAPYWNLAVDGAATIPGAQDDVGFLTQLIESTAAELCVDDARIYVTGNSNGAGMAATLACALPGRLAAIAPVSGINLAAPCDDLEPVSVIALHGDTDPLVPYNGGSAANVDTANPPSYPAPASSLLPTAANPTPRSPSPSTTSKPAAGPAASRAPRWSSTPSSVAATPGRACSTTSTPPASPSWPATNGSSTSPTSTWPPSPVT